MGVLVLALLVYFVGSHRQAPQAGVMKAAEVPTSVSSSAAITHDAAALATKVRAPSSLSHIAAADTLPPGFAAVPPAFQLPGVDRVRTGKSFADWKAQFPADTQKLMVQFNKDYFGVYRVNTPEQVAWMAAQGYPMPEDLVAAQGMSDQDLLDLAGKGNLKAAFILRMRDTQAALEGVSRFRAAGKTNTDFWGDDPLGHELLMHDAAIGPMVKHSGSAFKAFLQAADAAINVTDPTALSARIISSLTFANSLGDTRAYKLVESYAKGNPIREAIASGALGEQVLYIDLLSRMHAVQGCSSPLNNKAMPSGQWILP
ncbi:MAG: hypothetical protein L0H70_05130 [Xanthomonadales bacterium]|nr:hypothetical protein [Xanthomonadales bacterium]